MHFIPIRNGIYKNTKKMDTKVKEIKKVKVRYGTSEKLAKTFGVTTRCVGNAINGRTNSDLAQKIRQAAVELGGDPIYESIND